MSHLALDGTTSPAARRSFQKIHDAASGLRGILTDILDFSKIEAGKLSLEALDFSPEDVLHIAAELFALKAGEQGLELLVCHDLRMPRAVRGDPHRFAQILHNLLSNALKFTRAGEVVLTAHVQSLDETGCVLVCEVRDTGIGMSLEESSALFQPFSQADSSITRTFGGTGLGLSICKQLVEMLGGSISLSSELGRGTAVRFEVPFGAPGVEATPRAGLAAELSGERLLVVDDHEGSGEITCGLLRGLGLDPAGVHSGARALSLVTGAARGSAPFSAVLTDGRLSDVGAVELVRQLREAGFMGPVWLAATAAEQERAEATAEPCFAGVVSKPLRPSSLVDALMSGLRGVHRAPGPDPRRGPQPSFARHRVLLVEDNEDNREIAGEFLRRMGVTVTLACDGSEAIARVDQTPAEPGRRPFDLVLMDVQMPVMDGLTATRSIRALPDAARASVPIVAMTAHGMVGDREKSLQAGMQDHITKPIEPDALVRVLSRWKPPEPETILLDLAGGLRRVGGNEGLYHSILRRFCARHAESGDRMRTLVLNAPADATALAHDIKGTAANLGLDGLSAGAAALEQALRSGRPSEALLDAFEAAVDKTLRAVLEAVGEATTVAPAPDGRGADSELLELLRALEEPLRRRLAVRCRELAARLGGRGWDERYAEGVRALSAALTGYRFEAATAVRAQLMSTLEGAEGTRTR
jgi:CheY-like chemotaxis protein/HPt (histidine-containing phosphotransfer) domain-containing protein